MALQVLVSELVEPSNTLDITLDTFRVAVFGGSVLWGQGLTEPQKIHSQVAQVIPQREGGIGVYHELHAHSGAVIGMGNDRIENALYGEIPTDYPTILQQVDASINSPETVYLVLINGGINDEFRDTLKGWENERTVDAFVAYARSVVSRYKGSVDTWITLNEPAGSMIGVGYIGGIWPPGFNLDGKRGLEAHLNLLKSHMRAYNVNKELYGQQQSRVGIAHAMLYPRLTQAGGELGNVNEAAKNQFNYFYNEHFLDSLVNDVVDTAIHRRPANRNNVPSRDFYGLSPNEPWSPKIDFVGINYYRSVYVEQDRAERGFVTTRARVSQEVLTSHIPPLLLELKDHPKNIQWGALYLSIQ